MSDDNKFGGIILPGGARGSALDQAWDDRTPPIERFIAPPETGKHYETLFDYYYAALHAFCFMISRSIPEPFRGDSKADTELISCQAGIKAMRSCISIIEKQIQGTKPIIQLEQKGDYESLAKWYEDAIIQFIGDLSLDLPEKFRKKTARATELRSCKAIIRAFNKAIEVLEIQLRG